MRLLPALAAICVALLLVAGCKKSGPMVTLKKVPQKLPAGWTVTENAEQGLSIGMPMGWGIGSSETLDLQSLGGMGGDPPPANVAAEEEAMAKAEVKELEKKGIYLSIINKNLKPIIGEQRTRYNVSRVHVGGSVQMADVIEKVKGDLLNPDAPQTIELPIGTATKIRSKVSTVDGSSVLRIYYGLPSGEDIIVVRFITQQESSDIEQMSDQVMQTLRVDK